MDKSVVGAVIQRENVYLVEGYDSNGNLKWRDKIENLVVDEGLNDSLDKHLKGSNYTASWFVGLTDGTPTVAATDTAASHSGWTEVATYDETARPALQLGVVSGGSVDNSASKATYTINAAATIGGAFIISDSAKDGTGGILYGVGAFNGGDKVLSAGDTLNITVTCTASAL